MLVEDTTLLYSIDHPDPDENNFTVTVVPINEVGAGQPATHLLFNIGIGGSVQIASQYSSVFLIPRV